MPPKSKVTTRSAKKDKAGKEKVAAVVNSDHESDWTYGDEEPSIRNMVQSLPTMMASLNTRMDQMDGGGRKKKESNLLWCYAGY